MIVCNASGSADMATRNQSSNGAYTRSWHIMIAREIGVRTRHRLISVNHRYISCMEYGSVSRNGNYFFSDCYSCIRTWGEGHILRSTILKNYRPVGIWEIFRWIHILAWIYRSCIVFHKALVWDGSLQYLQCVPYAAFLQIFLLFSMIWYRRIQSSAVSKRHEVKWCSFHWSLPLPID